MMDNCKIHHTAEVKDVFDNARDSKGITQLFLPPYSPFLNPIELAFNVIKAKVKAKKLDCRGDLEKAVTA